jgi:hypothetical protein
MPTHEITPITIEKSNASSEKRHNLSTRPNNHAVNLKCHGCGDGYGIRPNDYDV